MIDSIINCKDEKSADCIILTANYDRTSSLGKGASKGGPAIIKCLREDIEFFDRYTLTEPGYIFKIAQKDIGVSNDLLPEKMAEKISAAYAKLMSDKKLLVLLGGDHSVSIGAFDAISKKNKAEDITIFQIDAHCDLREDDSNSNPNQSCASKYAHACVMKRAYDMGFNIVQVGIRSYAKEEYDLFNKNSKIKTFEWGKGKIPSAKELISSISTNKVYITLDVDGIDPAHIPGTGTPVPGGLEWYYTINLLNELIKKKKVIGIDIVEVAPKKDENLSQFAAAQLCYNMIGGYLAKKQNL